MLSIITAIYNQLQMNQLYYDSIVKSTDGEWELIIIDNGSTDGSREFFENLSDSRVKVVRNDGNYSYPFCQNKGIENASGDVMAFLNNDILLSRHWNSRISQVLGKEGYEVLSVSSNDNMPTNQQTRHISRKFKRIKYPLLALFGSKRWVLKLIVRLTYGNLDEFAEKMWEKYSTNLKKGFSGSVVVMTRKAIEILNGWDPTQQGADFDMALRTSKRWEEEGDIRPLSIIEGVMVHHFRRLTMREKFPPFKDASNLRSLEEKWGDRVKNS